MIVIAKQVPDATADNLPDISQDLIDYWSQQPLSDADYYSLMLGRYLPFLLALQKTPPTTVDAVEWNHLLVHQARFLIAHGNPEVLSYIERMARFGNDPYIARMILLCQRHQQEIKHLDALLWRIGSNANLFDSATQPGEIMYQPVVQFVQRRFDVTLKYPENQAME